MWSPCTQGQSSLSLILLPCPVTHTGVTFGDRRPDCRYMCIYFLGTVQQFRKMVHAHIYIYLYILDKHLGNCWSHANTLFGLFMGHESYAVTPHALAPEGKVALEEFCSTFPQCRQCLRRNNSHLSPRYRNSVRPGTRITAHERCV